MFTAFAARQAYDQAAAAAMTNRAGLAQRGWSAGERQHRSRRPRLAGELSRPVGAVAGPGRRAGAAVEPGGPANLATSRSGRLEERAALSSTGPHATVRNIDRQVN
jgi:hypothetical protein